MARKKVSRAKAMDVYGKPCPDILARLTKSQISQLDSYIHRAAGKAYRIAFECGREHAFREAKVAIERTANERA